MGKTMQNTRHNNLASYHSRLPHAGRLTPQLLIGAFLIFLAMAVALPRLNLRGGTLVIKDDNGDKWTLRRTGSRKPSAHGKTTAEPGPPLLVETNVSIRSRDVTIGMTIRGQAGEEYELSARKNGKRQALPTIDIFDAFGKHLHSAKFEYG